MAIGRYRKKPVIVEAVKWTGYNTQELSLFAGNKAMFKYHTEEPTELIINTLEGTMIASKDDMIIKGVNGEFYPCKLDIFEKTYTQEF